MRGTSASLLVFEYKKETRWTLVVAGSMIDQAGCQGVITK